MVIIFFSTFGWCPIFILVNSSPLIHLWCSFGCILMVYSDNFSLFPYFWKKSKILKKLSRFLYSKKMENIIFFNSESLLRHIPDIFYLLWEVFLIDFLSKMESQKAWNSFGTNSKWWILRLLIAKYFHLTLCVMSLAVKT